MHRLHIWTDIEPQAYSLTDFPVSKKLINLLRHGDLPREEDGAIEFWRLKDHLRKHVDQSQHWSDEKWKCIMAKGGGNKKRYQYCTDPSGEILYLRALQGHSGRNLIDPSLQDNVLIPNIFFEYIYHIGCEINLHSIMNSGLIRGGQNLSKRQTVLFTSVDPMNNEHRDPETVDLDAPRLAWNTCRRAWKKHQNTVYWVDIKLAQKKGFKFYQIRSNAIILYDMHSQPVVSRRPFMMGNFRNHISRKYMRHPGLLRRLPLEDNWMQELGSEVAGDGEELPTNPTKIKNPIITEQERPVVSEQTIGFDYSGDRKRCLVRLRKHKLKNW